MKTRAPSFTIACIVTGLGLCGCSTEPATSKATTAIETPTAAPEAPAPEAPANAQPTEPAPSQGEAKAAHDGEPDTSQEVGCVTFRWTSVRPTWQREEIAWDGIERTLRYEGTMRRFDAQGRVRDFGEGSARLDYDDKGNVTFRGEDPPKRDAAYRYRNTYDKQGRLTRVTLSYQGVGEKPGAYLPYREYRYDDDGRVVGMDVQLQPGPQDTPLTTATVMYDANSRITQVLWSGRPGVSQQDVFEYDAQGRLSTYGRDGLVVPGGRARDGLIDWRQRYEYDDTGRLRRVEALDGPDPARAQRDITLYSPACVSIGKILPDFLFYPYLPLPASSIPRWGG